MELKHESITLSSLVRRAASPNLLNLNLFFPRRWRRPGSRLSPFPLPPRPGYLKVPIQRELGDLVARAHSQVLFMSTMSVKCCASTVHRWILGSFQPYTACRTLNGTRNIGSIYMNGWKFSSGSRLVLNSKESDVWKVQFRIMDSNL